MGRKLIKPDASVDFYVEWSSIVEHPIRWGKRKKMVKWNWSDKHLQDADTHGSTWPGKKRWDIYYQEGILYWKDLPAVIDIYESGKDVELDDPRILALLEPFE